MALLTFVYEKEARSKSYIGKGLLKSGVEDGSVAVSGEGSVAASIEDRQEITKDDRYSEGLDTSIVSERVSQLDQIKNGIADAGQAAHRIGDAAQDVGAVAKGVSSGEMSMSEGIGLYGEGAELRDNTKVFQEEYEELTQKLNEGLGDGSVGETGMQDTIVDATTVIQDQQGVEEGNQGETYIYDGSGTAYKGFRDKETDDIGINVGEGGTNLNDGSETYRVMVHEVSHQNGADETKAHFLTDVAADSWNTENQFNGNETNTSKVNQVEWLNNQTTDSDGNRTADSLMNQNTIKASQVDAFDPLTVWDATDVAVFGLTAIDAKNTFSDPDSTNVDKVKAAGFLALDTAALLPIVPSIGYIRHADKLVDLTDTVSTAKVAKELTTAGKFGDAAGKVSATLSYGNNAKETIEGDRSNMRFLLDSSFYLGPKGLKSGIISEIAPNITRMSRTQASDSIINAASYGVNKELDED